MASGWTLSLLEFDISRIWLLDYARCFYFFVYIGSFGPPGFIL